MKVLIAATIGRSLDAFLREQILLLVARGHEVTLLGYMMEPVADLGDQVTIEVAAWTRPMPAWQWPAATAGTRRLLIRVRPDLVYTHTGIASTILRTAATTIRRRPVVVYCAHGFDGAAAQPRLRRYAARAVERALAHTTDLLFVMNDEDEDWATGVHYGRVVRVPSIGLPLDRFPMIAPRPKGPHRLVMIAEMNPRKRVDIMLRALALLDDRFTLTVLGDGPLQAALVHLATDLGIHARVAFPGHVADVRPYLSEAWLLASTARQEGVPRGVLEALASGLPVAALSARGVDDLLSSGGGVIVTGQAPQDLAAAIETIADAPAKWSDLRAAGLRNATQHDAGAIAERMVDKLEQTFRQHRAGAEADARLDSRSRHGQRRASGGDAPPL